MDQWGASFAGSTNDSGVPTAVPTPSHGKHFFALSNFNTRSTHPQWTVPLQYWGDTQSGPPNSIFNSVSLEFVRPFTISLTPCAHQTSPVLGLVGPDSTPNGGSSRTPHPALVKTSTAMRRLACRPQCPNRDYALAPQLCNPPGGLHPRRRQTPTEQKSTQKKKGTR